MSSNERRIAPRKIFSIPIRIRPLASESLSVQRDRRYRGTRRQAVTPQCLFLLRLA
jgi:hypothetical protein